MFEFGTHRYLLSKPVFPAFLYTVIPAGFWPEPNRKIKGNRTRIKSDLSGFTRILKTVKTV